MKNKYEINGSETIIYLKDKAVKIDTEDLSKVSAYNGTWVINDHKSSSYAAIFHRENKNSKQSLILMHRVIMNSHENKVIDHIDHNGLNNKKENLRECSNKENLQNRNGAQTNSKSGVRGIYWCKIYNKWVAQIILNKKKVWVRRFDDIEIAKSEIEKARPIYHPYAVSI
jgi:hypothetical protein